MSTRNCTDRGGRGCPCEWHAGKRAYDRRYAAKRRRAALDAQRMSMRTCPRRFGRSGVCGSVLRSDVIDGRIVLTCDACERVARGICRDCPAKVYGQIGKARRCQPCKVKAEAAATVRYTENHRHELRIKGRNAYKHNRAERKRRAEYKRQWRKANPEKVKAQKRREALTPNAKRVAYHAARREKNRAELAARQRDRNRGIVPLRTCCAPGCDRVVTHRKKKCTRCKESDRQLALAKLSTAAAA